MRSCSGREIGRFICFMFLLWCVSAEMVAQQDTIKTYKIDEVFVEGKRIMREVIPVQTLSGKEIERLSTNSVADAIRYFSGVQIKDYGGIGGLKTVNIRSMGTNHIGVFYDGIQLGNAQNGQIDLGRFSLENMEEIAVYNGQKSTIFQSAKDFGSASSIYLVSKKPTFSYGKQTNVVATFKTGSFGLVNPSVLWEQKLNSKTSTSFSSEWMHASGRYKFDYKTKNGYDTTAVRTNADINSVRLEGGITSRVKDGLWSTKAYYYTSERGLPGFIVNGVFSHEDRQWDRNFFMQSSFRKNIGEKFAFLCNAKYAYDYTHYLTPFEKDTSIMYINNRYKQQEFYFSSASKYSILPFWEAALSADFQWNKLNADLVNFAYPQRYTTLIAVASGLNFSQFKLQASVLGTFAQETVQVGQAAPNKSKFTPAIIASYRPWEKEDFNIRAFYKKIFRMPTFNDLYYTFIGNSLLKPEYATQYNAGVTYGKNFKKLNLQRIELQADAYYNEVTDKIIATPTSNFFRWTMINLGKVEIRGIDVAFQSVWKFNNNWLFNTRLSYTYQKAQDFTLKSDTYYGHQIPYIPWHSGSLILNGSYKSWDLNYSFIYTGERYESSANIQANYARPWYTSDLSASKRFKWNRTAFKLSAEVNNLLNQSYEVVLSYPMPGRNYKFIINITI